MPAVLLAPVLAQGIGLVAGAYAFKTWLEEEEKRRFMGMSNRCPTCNGSGKTECLCTRWSDGDAGCGACRGTGRMACRSCGGGGTSVPIPLTIRVRGNDGNNGNASRFNQAADSSKSTAVPQASRGLLPVTSAVQARIGSTRSGRLPRRGGLGGASKVGSSTLTRR